MANAGVDSMCHIFLISLFYFFLKATLLVCIGFFLPLFGADSNISVFVFSLNKKEYVVPVALDRLRVKTRKHFQTRKPIHLSMRITRCTVTRTLRLFTRKTRNLPST